MYSDDGEKTKVLLERLRMLEAEKTSLVMENENQSHMYEKCLDEITGQVLEALMTQRVRSLNLTLPEWICEILAVSSSSGCEFQWCKDCVDEFGERVQSAKSFDREPFECLKVMSLILPNPLFYIAM